MNDFALGVLAFVVVYLALGIWLVGTLRRARQEGLQGRALLGRLLPFFLADLALAALLVVWLLGRA